MKKNKLTAFFCSVMLLLSLYAAASAESVSGQSLSWTMPEDVILGNFLPVTVEGAEEAVSYEVVFTLANPVQVICTKQVNSSGELVFTSDGLYEGVYRVTLSAVMEDGTVLQGEPRPLQVRSVKKNYGFVMFADKAEVEPGEAVTISYRKYQENDSSSYPRQIVILSSDGQTQTVSDTAGTVEWVFSVPGDYEIGIGECNTENPAYKSNLPLRIHVPDPLEGELDSPTVSLRGTATMTDGAVFDYIPCANAEAAGVSVTYTLNIYSQQIGDIIYTDSQIGGSSFAVPAAAFEGTGIYSAEIRATADNGLWIPSSSFIPFSIMTEMPSLQISDRTGSSVASADIAAPFEFVLNAGGVTDGNPLLFIESIDNREEYFYEEIPLDPALLSESQITASYSFPETGSYAAYFFIDHPDPEGGDSTYDASAPMFIMVEEAPFSPLKYSWHFSFNSIVVEIEDIDPRADWCRAVLTRISDGVELSAGTPLQNQILLPISGSLYNTYAMELQISYGNENGETETVSEIIPLFDNLRKEYESIEYDPSFNFGQSGYGTIYVSKTEVTVGEEIEIFIWMNGNWIDVSIGDQWVSYYDHPEYYEESTKYVLFHAKNYSFSEPGLYRIFGASNPARGSNATVTDIIEVTVTGVISLENPVTEPVVFYHAGEDLTVPLLYSDSQTAFFDLVLRDPANPDVPVYEQSYEAGMPILLPAELFEALPVYVAELTARADSVVSDSALLYLYPAEYPDPEDPEVFLKANGVTEAAVAPGASVTFTFNPFTLQTDLYEACVLELTPLFGVESTIVETVDPESGIFSTSLDTEDLYRCDLRLWGQEDQPETDVLLGTVYVVVRNGPPFMLGIPQARYPRSIPWGQELAVEVLPLEGADWYEVDVLEERYNYESGETTFSSFFHIRLEEPGKVSIPTHNIISEYYHQNYNNDYWLRIRAGNDEHQAVTENEKQKNLFTVLMNNGEIPISVSVSEAAAKEPFTVKAGLSSNTYESLEDMTLSIDLFVDGMLVEHAEELEGELYCNEAFHIDTVGEHWIGAILTATRQYDDGYEDSRQYYSRKVPITINGDRVLDAPSLVVPESVNFMLPLEISVVENAESYLVRIWSDAAPQNHLSLSLDAAGTHSLDLSGLEPGLPYRVSVCAVAEGFASREAISEFMLGVQAGTIVSPVLTYNGSMEEAQIYAGMSATFSLEAKDASNYGFYPSFLLDDVPLYSPQYHYTDNGYSITLDTLEPGPHEISATLAGWYSNVLNGSYTSNTFRFQVISEGPVPMPSLSIPETIYENTYFQIGVGESDIPELKITAQLYYSDGRLISSNQMSTASHTIPVSAFIWYEHEDGMPYRLEITASAPGYEDAVTAFPVWIVPVETPGITLSLKQMYCTPNEQLSYAVQSVDCTLTALQVRNLTNPSLTYSNRTISLSGTYANSSFYPSYEAEYDIWAEGVLESGETVESEHFTVTVAYLGELEYPEVHLSSDLVYSSQSVKFSFSSVEHATSYIWYARSASGGSTSGTAYPNQINAVSVSPQDNWGTWYLEVVPRADGWKSPSYYTTRNSFLLFDGPDSNITLILGDEAAAEYTLPFDYGYDVVISMTAHAPGASAVAFLIDGYLSNVTKGDTANTFYSPYQAGDQKIYALACYDDSLSYAPHALSDWDTLSAPVTMHVVSEGRLDPPILTVPEEVTRGDLLPVDIAPVEHAEWYEIYITSISNGYDCYIGSFNHAGRVELPTATLVAGETYAVKAISYAPGWEPVLWDPEDEPENVFLVTEQTDLSILLSADKTDVLTMENYSIGLYAPDDVRTRLYLNGALIGTYTGSDSLEWQFQTVPGVYTWQFSVLDEDIGTWSEPAGDLPISVTAPKGQLAGDFSAEVPSSFPVDDSLTVTLTDHLPNVYLYYAELYAPNYSSSIPLRTDILGGNNTEIYFSNLVPGEPCRVEIVPYAIGYEGPRKTYYTVPVSSPEGEITMTLNGAAEDCSALLDEIVTVRAEAPEDVAALFICRNGETELVPGPIYEAEWICAEESDEYIYAWYTYDDIPEGETDYWNMLYHDGISQTLKLNVTALGTLEPVDTTMPENLLAGVPLDVELLEPMEGVLCTVDILSPDEDEADPLVSVSHEAAGTFTLSTEDLEPGQTYRVRITLSMPGWHPAVWEPGQFTLHYHLDAPQFTLQNQQGTMKDNLLLAPDVLVIQINAVEHVHSYTINITDNAGNLVYTLPLPKAGKSYVDSNDYLPTGRYTVTVECRTDASGFSTSSSSQELTVIGADWTSLRLPSGLHEIEAEAFEGISANYVLIPEGVTSIGDRAFAGSTALQLAVIPDTVTGISATAFADCPNVAILCAPDSPAAEYAEAQNIPLF